MSLFDIRTFRKRLRAIRTAFRPKGLKREIQDLQRKIPATDLWLEEVEQRFWREGGICCPGCGVQGFSDAQDAQKRRRLRLAQLQAQLERHRCKGT